MKKMIVKKIFESEKINGNLSRLCNIRDAIYFQNRERTNYLINIFDYNFNEVDYSDLLNDNDRIYVIQTASNKFLEVDENDLEKFDV